MCSKLFSSKLKYSKLVNELKVVESRLHNWPSSKSNPVRLFRLENVEGSIWVNSFPPKLNHSKFVNELKESLNRDCSIYYPICITVLDFLDWKMYFVSTDR